MRMLQKEDKGMDRIEILDDVPYWEFCLIRNDLVEEIMEQGVSLGYEDV